MPANIGAFQLGHMSHRQLANYECVMNRLLFAASLLLLISPLPAMGATITRFVEINNGAFNDAGLAGFRTYAMRVESDTDWTNADIRIDLTSGTFNHIESSGFAGGPEAAPQSLGDTAVFDPSPVGDITGGPGANLAVPHTESATSFSASWFNTTPDDIGTFDIAMITLSKDANGTLLFRTISGALVEEGGFTIGSRPITPNIINGCIGRCIPEPSTATLLLICCVLPAVARRRR